MAKCKCKSCPRIVSNMVQSMDGNCCLDVCSTPLYGEPDTLGIYAPLIYDEIGINLCTTFAITGTIPATATNATAKIIDTTFTIGADNVTIEGLAGRPNCYRVTLSNLSVTFALNLYDSACRQVGTLYPDPVVYLPSDTTAPTYDEDTNPTSVELDIYAPYGLTYDTTGATPTPTINFIGSSTTNSTLRQGINLYAIAKILDFSTEDATATVGVTFILQSLYFAGYKVPSLGKIDVPKGSILPPDDTACMRFVAGNLLNLEIRPLSLGEPDYEETNKTSCCNTGSANGGNLGCTGNCSCNRNCTCGEGAVDETVPIAPPAPAPTP